MKKTSVYLEPSLDLALSQIAQDEGISKAQVIRRALQAEARRRSSTPVRSVGVYSGPRDLSVSVDRHLEGFGEK